jgi:hypothetical protein
MFANRLLLMISILAFLLMSLAVARPLTRNVEPVDTSWPPRPDYSHLDEPPMASIPYTDYYQRHPELRPAAGSTVDTTDYFLRHPELRTTSVDLSDYFFRHTESN